MIPEEGQNWNNPIWMDQKLQLIETGHLMKRMERELVHMLIGVNTAQNPAGHHTKRAYGTADTMTSEKVAQ